MCDKVRLNWKKCIKWWILTPKLHISEKQKKPNGHWPTISYTPPKLFAVLSFPVVENRKILMLNLFDWDQIYIHNMCPRPWISRAHS